MIIYITDITTREVIRTKYYGAMPVLVHIQVDNYDDVLKGLSESQRTSVLSEVHQKLVEVGH